MKQGSALFLKGVILLIGLAVLVLCVYVLPHTIGSIDAGGYDPILLGMYVPAIPFFIALYKSMKLLNNIDKNQVFSQPSVNALKTIKYCGVAISAMYLAALPYVVHLASMPYIKYMSEKDNIPSGVVIVLVIIFASFVITTAAGVGQSLLQNAVDIKAENDLTV